MWLVDNADRVIATICAATGKTYKDAQIAEISYRRFGRPKGDAR